MPKTEVNGFEWGCDACSKKAMAVGGDIPDGWFEGSVSTMVQGQVTQIQLVVCSTPHITKAVNDYVQQMKGQ